MSIYMCIFIAILLIITIKLVIQSIRGVTLSCILRYYIIVKIIYKLYMLIYKLSVIINIDLYTMLVLPVICTLYNLHYKHIRIYIYIIA